MSANLAEIRSLVIHPNYHGQGIGRQIVCLLLDEARSLDLEQVIALTRKPDFFMKLGFELTRLEKLPRKIRRDCVFCVKFHVCDEVALTIHPQQIILPDQPRVEKNGAMPPAVATMLAGNKSV
jgi:amino-acid N-acetyltransferase